MNLPPILFGDVAGDESRGVALTTYQIVVQNGMQPVTDGT